MLVIQILVSLALIGVIAMQSKGGGLGREFGGKSSFTRRGLEKMVFRSTFALTFVFILVSILQLVI